MLCAYSKSLSNPCSVGCILPTSAPALYALDDQAFSSNMAVKQTAVLVTMYGGQSDAAGMNVNIVLLLLNAVHLPSES